MLKLRGFAVLGVLVGLAALGARPADAQSVTTSSINLTTNTLYNLTSAGPDGWRMWYSADPNGSNYSDATGQTFTTTVFGNAVNNFDNSGNGNNGIGFQWTNGNSGDNSLFYGNLFRDATTSGDSTNSGFNVSVPTVGPTGSVQLFVLSFGDAARLNVQLKNSSGTQLSSMTDASFLNQLGPLNSQQLETGYYTVNYSGAVAGDTLLLTYSVGTDWGSITTLTPGYIGIQAAALHGSAAVPEPAAVAMLGIALLGCVARRRCAS